MNLQNYEQARQYALNRLEKELSPNLLYHGLAHTRDEVVPAAEMLAGMEGICGEPLYLLRTAAWLHDIGFIEQSVNHEKIGARIAAEVLPGFGFSDQEVKVVRNAIMATMLPQAPTTLLEKIMADADLAILGRPNFMPRNDDLRQELAYFGKEFTDMEWYSRQLSFIETHAYFTESARELLDAQKLINITELKQTLMTHTP